jgi:hypothetical protein
MYKVEDYEFETEEQAKAARQELEQVHYLKEQTGMDDPDVVLTLYNKLVQRRVFSTPVGLGYLIELQDYLNAVPYIKKEEILPLLAEKTDLQKEQAKKPAKKQAAQKVKKEPDPEAEERAKQRQIHRQQEALVRKQIEKCNYYRKMFHISTFFAVVFALAMVGMVVITIISKDNVNIVNYENTLIDKYESWEQELNEREAQLEQREQQIEAQEGQE